MDENRGYMSLLAENSTPEDEKKEFAAKLKANQEEISKLNDRLADLDSDRFADLRIYPFFNEKTGQTDYDYMGVTYSSPVSKEWGKTEEEPAQEQEKTERWSIVHEMDDEDGTPQEWSTKFNDGSFAWIDREENGFAVYDTPHLSAVDGTRIKPLATFRTLDEAQQYAIDTLDVNAERKDKEFSRKLVEQKENGNFHITDYNLGKGGAKEKFRRNIEAIKTLRTIEEEGRSATLQEKEILSQYIGWGGLPDAFARSSGN